MRRLTDSAARAREPYPEGDATAAGSARAVRDPDDRVVEPPGRVPRALPRPLRARFTIRLLGTPPFVMLSDPERDQGGLHRARPTCFIPARARASSSRVVGSNSVILLDEGAHLSQRKLMLPGVPRREDGEALRPVAEVAEREVESWPRDTPIELHPRLQALTLEVILRAVFGLDPGAAARGDPRPASPRSSRSAPSPISMIPQLQRALVGRGRWGRFDRAARRDRRADLRADRGAPRRRRGARRRARRCCSRRATRTARRCPPQSCATS